MSIYSRSYMRDTGPAFGPQPWALKGILIALVVVFVLQNIARFWLGSTFMEATFGLSLNRIADGWLHTLLSYGFLHATGSGLPWHILFNGLILYWFGKEIEDRFGSERFLECFLLCVFTGGVIWSCVHFFAHQGATVVGASSGVFGIIYLFCRQRWHFSLQFILIPIQFTGRQLFYVLLGFQVFFLLFAELPASGTTATAHSAHLGGVLGAFLYERYLLHRSTLISFFRRQAQPEIRPPEWARRSAKTVKATTSAGSARKQTYKVNLTDRSELRREVDRILDKINHQGFGALSREEKDTLDKAKDLL